MTSIDHCLRTRRHHQHHVNLTPLRPPLSSSSLSSSPSSAPSVPITLPPCPRAHHIGCNGSALTPIATILHLNSNILASASTLSLFFPPAVSPDHQTSAPAAARGQTLTSRLVVNLLAPNRVLSTNKCLAHALTEGSAVLALLMTVEGSKLYVCCQDTYGHQLLPV